MNEQPRYGLDPRTIAMIEEELPVIDVDTVTSRMDQIFSKGWTIMYEGPELVDVPVKPVKQARSTAYKTVPHWQCRCTIEIGVPDDSIVYRRDYTMLLEATPGAFEVIRDLSLIYCLVKCFGLGKAGASKLPVADTYRAEEEPAPRPDHELAVGELNKIKSQLGITKNTELDQYVSACFHGKLATYRQIGKNNVRTFVEYLKEGIANGVISLAR